MVCEDRIMPVLAHMPCASVSQPGTLYMARVQSIFPDWENKSVKPTGGLQGSVWLLIKLEAVLCWDSLSWLCSPHTCIPEG